MTPSQAIAWLARRARPPAPLRVAGARQAARSTPWPALARAAAEFTEPREPDAAATLALAERAEFRFLGERRELARIDWDVAYGSPLWRYHLRYFDYGVDLAVAWRRTGDRRFGDRLSELWRGWLDRAEAGPFRVAPYPTAVRSMNALHVLWLVEDRLPHGLADRILRATRGQLAWLADHLERDLRANHLQKDLTALAWGSLAFADDAAPWVPHREELWREVREQVLPDGGHFERSPMYHALALQDFLRTVALCRAATPAAVPADIPERLAAMVRALQWLSRPDGTLHQFNDAAQDPRVRRTHLVALARSLLGASFDEPEGEFSLPDTGYYGVVEPRTGCRFVIDAGPLGPAYQPGHAHSDMLSYELDLDGSPLVVDSGLSGYDGDPFREYVRHVRAHNTVAIDGRDQHEMWATFRVARRGAVLDAAGGRVADGAYEFRAACRSYHARRAVHVRRVRVTSHGLVVRDRVEGAAGAALAGWIHLAPELTVERQGDDLLVRDASGPRARIEVTGADRVAIRRGERDPAQGWVCPRFGEALPAPVVEMRVDANGGGEFGYSIRSVR